MQNFETICAISTPIGIGGIAVVRISGNDTKKLCNNVLRTKNGKNIVDTFKANQAHYCHFFDGNYMLDEVVATFFEAPHSYTGEDVIEIACHGSKFVQQKIIETLVQQGVRLAEAGEFTLRAFVNGKLDLSQAEAVADLIDSQSESAHRLAINQLRGGFSKKLSQLRQQFVELAALLELELDFSEEDVEFADRNKLQKLLQTIEIEVKTLLNSFKNGNALKNGVPVAIVGQPNVGKSTLLNALLNEERAIVSDIPGTTRDTIEDTVTFDGISFRFIDTAGIRNSNNEIEQFGIKRTFKAAEKASVVLYMIDISKVTDKEIQKEINNFKKNIDITDKHLIIIANKNDIANKENCNLSNKEVLYISAKNKQGISLIINKITSLFKEGLQVDNTLLTNVRHYEAMQQILSSISVIKNGLDSNLPGDLVMVDIRQALYYIGLITGEVATDEILGTIFSRFCVGK